MKNLFRLFFIIILFSFVTFLTGCVSSETKNVMSLIDNIGEVSIDSKSAIEAAANAYDLLNEKDKKEVKNIDDLYDAQKTFESVIPEYIESQVSYFRFAKRINYDDLKQFVTDYYTYLDDEQIEIIGCAIGQCKVKDMVISKVKEKMKNPSSFELIDFDPGYIMKQQDGNYSTLFKISYRGSNSFGGIVPGTTSGTIDFKVNFDDCTISYVRSFIM